MAPIKITEIRILTNNTKHRIFPVSENSSRKTSIFREIYPLKHFWITKAASVLWKVEKEVVEEEEKEVVEERELEGEKNVQVIWTQEKKKEENEEEGGRRWRKGERARKAWGENGVATMVCLN